MEKLQPPMSPQPSTPSSPTLTLEAAKAAKLLLGCYRKGDANDPEIYVQAVVSVLAEYPSEVIKAVCDPRYGLPAKSKWLPTVSEVKEACEIAMVPIDRMRRQRQLENERRLALAKPHEPRVTLEELKAKYGENWGLHPERSARTKWQPPSLDEICAAAGVSRDEVEEKDIRAREALR